MTNMGRVFAMLQLFGAVAAIPGPAKCMQIQLNGGNPYLCAVVQFANTASGTPVIAAPCSGGPEDQWNWVNGQLEGIGTANGKANCLNVAGPFSSGTLVDIVPCSTGVNLNQLWVGEFGLLAVDSVGNGWCLDSHGGPVVGGGTQLVINPCTGVSSQNWILRGMQLQGAGKAPYMCANVQGSRTAGGTPILGYSCDDAPNELWNFQGGQFLGIGTENGISECLTAKGNVVGSPVVLTGCGPFNQQWIIASPNAAPGAFMEVALVNGPSIMCLDRSGPSLGGGTELVVNFCLGSASQNWVVR